MTDIPMEELLLSIFGWTCIAAWRALPIFVVVACLDLVWGRRIAPRFQCLLWSLVVVRLLFPVSVESPFSMHGRLEPALAAVGFQTSSASPPPAVDFQEQQPRYEDFTFEGDEGPVTVRLPVYVAGPAAIAAQGAEAKAAQPLVATHPDLILDGPQYAPMHWTEWVLLSIETIWIVVFAGLMLRALIRYCRFSWTLRRTEAVNDSHVIDEVLRVCDQLRVGKRPALKEVAGQEVPGVFGILRPTVCLPLGALETLSAGELRLILLHEIAHVKRRDGLLLSIASFVRALHWYNPLAWIAVARIRTYMEQSADDLALRRSNDQQVQQYGQLLLDYATTRRSSGSLATVGLLFSLECRSLANRIKMLHRRKRRNHWGWRCVASLALLSLALTGLTDAHSPPSIQAHAADAWAQGSELPLAKGPWKQLATKPVAKTYDAAAALERIRQLHPELDAKQTLIEQLALLKATWNKEGEQLTVEASKPIHEQLEGRLSAIAKSGFWQIEFEIHVAHTSLQQLKQLDVNWANEAVQPASRKTSLPTGNPFENAFARDTINLDTPVSEELTISLKEQPTPLRPICAVKVARPTVEAFIKQCKESRSSSLVAAPKMTLFNGQSAFFADETQRPFVTGVRPVVGENAVAMQPIIDVLSEGTRLHIQSEITKDERLSLRSVLTLSEVGDVSLANLPFDGDDPESLVTVQVPRARSISAEAAGRLKRSECLLLACPTTFDDKQPKQQSSALCFVIMPKWSRTKLGRE